MALLHASIHKSVMTQVRIPRWLKSRLAQGIGDAGTSADEARTGALGLDALGLHDHLYRCLSVLDDKADALLQFDAILVATSAVVLTIQSSGDIGGIVLLGLALAAATFSSACTLFVVQVYWTEASELTDYPVYNSHLRKVLDQRTLVYRMAWHLAAMSLALLAIGAPVSQM